MMIIYNNPVGMRIVLGREKSPTPDIPHQVLEQYNGKTREVSSEQSRGHITKECGQLLFFERGYFVTK